MIENLAFNYMKKNIEQLNERQKQVQSKMIQNVSNAIKENNELLKEIDKIPGLVLVDSNDESISLPYGYIKLFDTELLTGSKETVFYSPISTEISFNKFYPDIDDTIVTKIEKDDLKNLLQFSDYYKKTMYVLSDTMNMLQNSVQIMKEETTSFESKLD